MLKLSKKADYALMALQYMGSVQFSDLTRARVVNTKEIAEENNIPVELLAKVLQALAKQEIIESHNGPKGGYILGHEPRDITIAKVLEAIEGPLGIADCYHENDHSPCEQLEHCNIRTPLLKVQESIYQLLSSMTIEDMMSGQPLIIVESRKTEGVNS
ncbi:MAG: Rrf2 family transcriptional regulator [Nitrospirota bacterium]|nr:MAG: Rrf2 family transcriptional regulator [Nitrospirota bacterium]